MLNFFIPVFQVCLGCVLAHLFVGTMQSLLED